ncbi:hypothetical protein GYMLUDRAFT_60677 [Collybiopsis luxurians FD-317 M1]|uniref:Cytochrome P450 n=1 Tax=Collybiopsis luxurians FD-317 M1 TaxID=944289 RepID=A0A0D0B5M9_9AGAR|nr:hypothetical protein GYMLUDRAFT_60677 [Collybiopsis luxurians FD-317 M1]
MLIETSTSSGPQKAPNYWEPSCMPIFFLTFLLDFNPNFGQNLQDMPTIFPWITFSQWAKEFQTDILHLDVAGSSYIILNTYEAANDLLDKRSSIYSSRPPFAMHELMGLENCLKFAISWNRDFVLMPYGEDWNSHRKLFHQEFHPVRSESLHRLHGKKALGIFLNSLLHSPQDWKDQIRHMVGSIILGVAYGIRVQSQDDPNIKAIEKMNLVVNEAVLPTKFLVNVIPMLKYVPSWFPGASFKRKAKAWNGIFSATIKPPFLRTKNAMINGTADDCFSLRCLKDVSDPDPRPDYLSKEEEIIMETAGTMYEGGADSGTIALETFMLTILCFPHVQREAQAELDRVVGRERLPEHIDRELLPYVTAVMYECFRPGVAHRVDADDTYKGYHIPKNSTVLPNMWAMLHDPNVYGSDADTFEPKRWLLKISDDQGITGEWKLNPDMRDPLVVTFGFGRRVNHRACPGKHLAISTFWTGIASILHLFNVTPAIDEDSNKPIQPKVEYSNLGLFNFAPVTT